MSAEERYVLLGLRLGRHVDGLVDSYYGPVQLKEQVDNEELLPAEQLVADGASLVAELDESWLRDCAQGLETYARVLAGESISYSDEVERCYGVRPERKDESVFLAAHEQLEALLPGKGTLGERREAWRDSNRVDPQKLMPIVNDLFALVRQRTDDLFGLVDREEITVEEVHDEPWWAFNYYQGNRRSHVVLNVDVPTTYGDLLELCCHEGYPGHHTERTTKEVVIVEGRGDITETINMVPTPVSILAEGIATTATDILGPETHEAALAILRKHGVEYDDVRAKRISDAFKPIGRIGVDVALRIHEDGMSEEDAVAWGMKWGVTTEARAKQGVRFVTDATWRAYVICYTAGEELVRGYTKNDPARFKQLLNENVRIRDLAAAS
ncbi:MAG TPA: hypothetical protein VGL84_03635 [Gaiellaceae bacterium]